MFESKVIAAFLLDRKDYDNSVPHLDLSKWSPMGLAFLELVRSYYDTDPEAESVDRELLVSAVERRFKDVPKHLERAHDFLVEIDTANISASNVIKEIIEQKRAIVGTLLADALLAQDDERIEMYLQDYERLSDVAVLEDNVEDEYIGVSLDQLAEQFNEDGTWHLGLRELKRRMRPVRAGHSIVVAARPERGKTLFGISFASAFLQQGAKVLYIGNEDPIPDLVIRLLSNLSGMNEDQMFADRGKAMSRAMSLGYDRCVFVGLSPGTLYEIEALVRRHEPDVLIVDQMRNVRANTENNTQRLEVVAQELRNIARRHEAVSIGLTQVGDSGRNKLELDDGDIDGSNTGIPGACDVIIMIGSNDDFERRDLRRLTLAKNKRGGDHASFTVAVNRALSRVVSYEPGG